MTLDLALQIAGVVLGVVLIVISLTATARHRDE